MTRLYFTDRVCSWQNGVEDDHDGGPEDGDLQTVNLCSGGVRRRIYLTIILTEVLQQRQPRHAEGDAGADEDDAAPVAEPVVQQPPDYPAHLRSERS